MPSPTRTATAFRRMLLGALACMYAMHASAAAADTHSSLSFASQVGRHLLHGQPPRGGWVRCPRCSLVRCIRNDCSGHCRNNGIRPCRGERPNSTEGAAATGFDGLRIDAPRILCNRVLGNACSFTASQILPNGGFPVSAPNGTVSAFCEPAGGTDPAAPLGPGVNVPPGRAIYGACVCNYASADGSQTRTAFCAPSAAFTTSVQRQWLEVYTEEVLDTELPLDIADLIEKEEWVLLGDDVATITTVPPVQTVDFEVDGAVLLTEGGNLPGGKGLDDVVEGAYQVPLPQVP